MTLNWQTLQNPVISDSSSIVGLASQVFWTRWPVSLPLVEPTLVPRKFLGQMIRRLRGSRTPGILRRWSILRSSRGGGILWHLLDIGSCLS